MKIKIYKHFGAYALVGKIELFGKTVADIKRDFHIRLKWPVLEKLDLALLDLECGLLDSGITKLKKLRKQLERPMQYDDSNLNSELAGSNDVSGCTDSDNASAAGAEETN